MKRSNGMGDGTGRRTRGAGRPRQGVDTLGTSTPPPRSSPPRKPTELGAMSFVGLGSLRSPQATPLQRASSPGMGSPSSDELLEGSARARVEPGVNGRDSEKRGPLQRRRSRRDES